MTDELEYLKQRIPCWIICSSATGQLARGRPSGVVGLCPLHPEYKASFYVNASKNLFYCHVAPWGDLIRFIGLSQGLSFRQSVAYLQQQIPPLPIPNGWKRSLRSTNSNPRTAERFLISNDVGCAMPASSRMGIGYAPPSVSAQTIWLPMVMASIDCSKPDLLLPRDGDTCSAAV